MRLRWRNSKYLHGMAGIKRAYVFWQSLSCLPMQTRQTRQSRQR